MLNLIQKTWNVYIYINYNNNKIESSFYLPLENYLKIKNKKTDSPFSVDFI